MTLLTLIAIVALIMAVLEVIPSLILIGVLALIIISSDAGYTIPSFQTDGPQSQMGGNFPRNWLPFTIDNQNTIPCMNYANRTCLETRGKDRLDHCLNSQFKRCINQSK